MQRRQETDPTFTKMWLTLLLMIKMLIKITLRSYLTPTRRNITKILKYLKRQFLVSISRKGNCLWKCKLVLTLFKKKVGGPEKNRKKKKRNSIPSSIPTTGYMFNLPVHPQIKGSRNSCIHT